jgi:hypothetical protein
MVALVKEILSAFLVFPDCHLLNPKQFGKA